MFLLLLLVWLLSSCGPEFACRAEVIPTKNLGADECTMANLVYHVDDPLRSQVESFSADARKRNVPCTITAKITLEDRLAKSSENNVIGYCLSPWRVTILQSFWEEAPASERLALIYHELGHCALGLDHYDEKPDIMNTYILNEFELEKNWDKLVTIMFERASK